MLDLTSESMLNLFIDIHDEKGRFKISEIFTIPQSFSTNLTLEIR